MHINLNPQRIRAIRQSPKGELPRFMGDFEIKRRMSPREVMAKSKGIVFPKMNLRKPRKPRGVIEWKVGGVA